MEIDINGVDLTEEEHAILKKAFDLAYNRFMNDKHTNKSEADEWSQLFNTTYELMMRGIIVNKEKKYIKYVIGEIEKGTVAKGKRRPN